MTQMATEQVIQTTHLEPGDHERLAHYVKEELLVDAMVFGTPLLALCGKMWVPTRDGLKFPVCPECREAYDALEFD